VVPIRETRCLQLVSGVPSEDADVWITSSQERGEFRAVATRAEFEGNRARLPKDACARLDLSEGDELALTPLPTRGKGRG
jgi:arginine/ornithine N-succinyltransferase beta subunit